MSGRDAGARQSRPTGPDAPDGGARQVRNRQLLLFSAVSALALVALAAWLSGSGGGSSAPGARIAAEVAGPDTAEDTWTRRSEARMGRLEADLRDVRNANRQLADENRRLLEEIRGNADEAKGIIDRLTAALGEAASVAPANAESANVPVFDDPSAGVASQGDPRPVLLRITGPAWTAAEGGTAQSVDLHGCTVTGAAYGDLSSEKVYARLRTLTCAGEAPGTVVETEVAGFVAGTGKAGVRGLVVSREGALVEKAFFAGLVSGVGQGVAGAFAPQAVATGTSSAAVANTGLDEIGRAGLGAGASSAGRRVSDYLIRRAEQYQPVIQLQAGTAVTVVFLEGTRLDGRPDTQPQRRTNNDD